MKLIHKIADRALERLAPSSKADASGDPFCWWADCGNNCVKRCCTGSGCSSICVCPV